MFDIAYIVKKIRKNNNKKTLLINGRTTSIHQFPTAHNTHCLPLPPTPQKNCITFVSSFSWVLQVSQEKLKTFLMPYFFSEGGGTMWNGEYEK